MRSVQNWHPSPGMFRQKFGTVLPEGDRGAVAPFQVIRRQRKIPDVLGVPETPVGRGIHPPRGGGFDVLQHPPRDAHAVDRFPTLVRPIEIGAPLPLLQALQTIERDMGRTAKSTNGTYADRIIDIDILLYDNCVIDTPQLTIPHPLMHQRLFVLEPLCEIAPKRLHPILGKSIAQLLKNIKES